MKISDIKTILSLVLTLLVSVSLVNAVADFSVTPSTITDTVELGTTEESVFLIQNTGNETLNLDLISNLLLFNGDSIAINLNTTSITDLAEGENVAILASYSPSGVDSGAYTGSVVIRNSDNTSQSEAVSFNVDVEIAQGSLITIDDVTSGIVQAEGDIGEKEKFNIRLRNSGSINLTDVKFEFADLDGDEYGDKIKERYIDVDDEGFDLDVGDSDNVRIEIDVPDDINLDLYIGEITISTDQNYDVTYELQFETTGGDLEVNIRENELDVDNGVLKIYGEAGEKVDNFEFKISNDGNVDLRDLVFSIDGNFEEEFSNNELDTSIVEFSPDSVDVDSDDQETIEVIVDIPEDAESGTYYSEIDVKTSTGDLQDSIRFELKVVGDVFISNVEVPETVKPGDKMDVEVTVENTGSTLQRNVKITGTFFDADIGDSDIIESTSTFILDVNDEKTETMRFAIPDEAGDGSHTLEIRVSYGDEDIIELEDVIIDRELHNLVFDSYGINPSVVRCDDNLYTFMDVENLGKYDEDVVYSVEILGTTFTESSSAFELGMDESLQRNFNLDITGIEPGTYTVEHVVTYNGDREVRASTLTILECTDASIGITVKPDNGNTTGLSNETIRPSGEDNETITVFSKEFEKTTVYLAGGVGAVFLLIIISLFFL